MPPIENTSKRDPLLHLALGMGPGGGSGYIEDMEAAGAEQVAGQDTTDWVEVPKQGSAALEDLGIELGPEGDDLFRKVKLPEGWTIQRSGHDMWTYIHDERGFKRVAMFYKAAFYDRSAHLSVERLPKTDAQEKAVDLYDQGWSMDYELTTRDGDDLAAFFKPGYKSEVDPDSVRMLTVQPDGTVIHDQIRSRNSLANLLADD